MKHFSFNFIYLITFVFTQKKAIVFSGFAGCGASASADSRFSNTRNRIVLFTYCKECNFQWLIPELTQTVEDVHYPSAVLNLKMGSIFIFLFLFNLTLLIIKRSAAGL